MNGEILTPASPRWHDFMLILTGPTFLDFHLDVEDEVREPTKLYGLEYNVDGQLAWHCPGNNRKPYATIALQRMDGIDVEATLAQWPDLCDCDLVFKLGNEEEE